MRDFITKVPPIVKLLDEISSVSSMLWDRGWAEKNAGNISIDITEQMSVFSKHSVKISDVYPLCNLCFNSLRGRFFLLTSSGTRFRDLVADCVSGICVIQISSDGLSYRIIANSTPMARPTSELATHMMILNHLLAIDSDCKVILHTHPTELISLSHMKRFSDEQVLNRSLLGMMPEVKIVIPGGIGLVPYILPGSSELAASTVEAIKRGRKMVLWRKHGCLVVDKTIDEAFDRIDTMNKAALIIMQCLAAGEMPEGLTDKEILELEMAFKLK